MALSAADKDRIAKIVHRAAHRVARGEDQIGTFEEEFAGFSSEERTFASALIKGSIARREEQLEAKREAVDHAFTTLAWFGELFKTVALPLLTPWRACSPGLSELR
jgi:hypothetical protein